MKKWIFILPVIFMGCAMTSSNTKPQDQARCTLMGCATQERNEQCADFEEVKVFQTFNDGQGALAFVCERQSYDDSCLGMIVAVRKEPGKDLWDDKRIKATKEKCFAYDGVYKYTSKGGMDKTIPIVQLEYAYPPASEKELLGRMENARTNMYYECLNSANAEFKNEEDKNIKKCECFADLTIKKFADTASSDNGMQEIKTEQFAKNLIAEIENKCGKLPKSMKF